MKRFLKTASLSVLILSALSCAKEQTSGNAKVSAIATVQAAGPQIVNNTQWKDSLNSPIEARMGTILDNRLNSSATKKKDKKIFWYGRNDKKCSGVKYFLDAAGKLVRETNYAADGTVVPDLINGVRQSVDCTNRVNAYSSTNLVNWVKEKDFAILDIGGNAAAVGGNVLFNSSEKTYILYGTDNKIYVSNNGPAGTFKATGAELNFGRVSKLKGGFKSVQRHDFGVFQDPYTGDAFIVARTSIIDSTAALPFSDADGEVFKLRIYKLDPTYQSILPFVEIDTPNGGLIWADSIRRIESPSLFIRDVSGTKYYYVSGSETEGWGASDTYYKFATGGFGNIPSTSPATFYNYADGRECSIIGVVSACDTGWKKLLSSDPNIGANKSFMTQHNAIIRIPVLNAKGKITGEQFMYTGERWSDSILDPDYMCDQLPPPFNVRDCRYISKWPKYYLNQKLTTDPLGPSVTTRDSHYHWAPMSFAGDGTISISPAMKWSPGLK